MNNGLKIAFAFITGAAAGSVVAWKLLEKRYADIAQEEIDSVKEVYSRKYDNDDTNGEPVEDTSEESGPEPKEDLDDIAEYESIISKHYGTIEDLEKGGSEPMKDETIRILSPSEFNDIDEDEYDVVTLTYYANGVLADEFDNVIEDVENTVGTDALNSFGEYEDDSVFVLNETYGTAYEILLDESDYGSLYPADSE